MMQQMYNLNVLDRILSFFAAQSMRASVGETFYQGTNNPHFYFVDSVNGSDNNDGSDLRSPLATIEEAFDRVSANRGDVIFVMPGHVQTYTADAVWDVSGVAVIGMGLGTKRPTFTIGDAAGESLNLTAANIHIENLIFICGVDQQTYMMGIAATDCTVKDCEFREGSALQPLAMIDVGAGGAANAADRTKIVGCYFYGPTAGDGDHAIGLEEVEDRVEIRNCVAWGDWDDACIHNVTGKILTNLLIADCILTNLLTGQHAIELISACTGNLVRNLYHTDLTQQTGVDPGSCFSMECFQADAIDTSGILTPIIT